MVAEFALETGGQGVAGSHHASPASDVGTIIRARSSMPGRIRYSYREQCPAVFSL